MEIDGDVHLFIFRAKILFLGKFGSKIQNCLFNMKFNSNMPNSMVAFTFSVLDQKYYFCQICSKNQKLFEVKFGIQTLRIWRINYDDNCRFRKCLSQLSKLSTSFYLWMLMHLCPVFVLANSLKFLKMFHLCGDSCYEKYWTI